MHNRIVCICVVSPHCGWVCAVSDVQLDQMNLHILNICVLPSVGDHVHPQMSCKTKWLLTLWASVGFHSTVGEHVSFQVSSLNKWISALCTFVDFLPCVADPMHPPSICLTKWLLTLWASVGLHSTMTMTKWLVALNTRVRSFSAVGDKMRPQVCCLTKYLLTFWASMGPYSTVGEHVLFQIKMNFHILHICVLSPLCASCRHFYFAFVWFWLGTHGTVTLICW